MRRIHLRRPQLPQSRTRRRPQNSHGQGRSRHRLSQAAGARAPVSSQRLLPGGFEPRQLSTARLQASDGLLRLYRRPASLRISRRATSQTPPREKRLGSSSPPPGTRKIRQPAIPPMKAPHTALSRCRAHLLKRAASVASRFYSSLRLSLSSTSLPYPFAPFSKTRHSSLATRHFLAWPPQ